MARKFKDKEKIVFLDAGSVDYGDISLSELAALGNFTAYERTAPQEIAHRIAGVPIVITNKCRFDAATITRASALRGIFAAATGVNNIDLNAARAQKICVANVSGYSTETVVQFTFAFILALAGNLLKYNHAAHDGTWGRSHFFMLPGFPIREVAGKKIGILGYGSIGRRVAEMAKAFGMNVLIAKIPGKNYPRSDRVPRVSLDRLIREADFVTIHAPLSDLTRGLINREVLAKMKPGAFLINMARGGIVDESALREALRAGRLAGAACDVLSQEPPPADHILLGAPNLLLTPHIAWASLEARGRLVHEMALNIKAFQGGRRRNRVV